jgi:hypothetical protein
MSDESIAVELSAVLARVEPVPGALLDGASAILAWRDVDARLAVLIAEEQRRDLAGVAVRGAPPRLLTFTVDGVTIDIEVSEDDGRVRLLGQIVPMGAVPVEVRHRDGVWTGRTDPLGRFSVSDLPSGAMRICCRPDGAGAAVCTAVFTA